MTGLMYYRPDDHINYLKECLSRVEKEGMDNVRWNIFIDAHRGKTPLPPIGSAGSNGRTQPQMPAEPGFLRGKQIIAISQMDKKSVWLYLVLMG